MDIKSAVKNILTFSAFSPEEDNSNYTWKERFKGKKSSIININKDSTSCCFYNKKGKISNIDENDVDFKSLGEEVFSRWTSNITNQYLGVSINNKFVVSLENNLSRKKGWEKEFKRDPKSILGSKYNKSKRYSLFHNSISSSSLLLSCDDNVIEDVVDQLRNRSLKPARICVGSFSVFLDLINKINSSKDAKNKDYLIINWFKGSLFILRQTKAKWVEVRCRNSLDIANNPDSISNIVVPFIEKSDKSTEIIFMDEVINGPFTTLCIPLLKNQSATNITQRNHFWNFLYNN